MTIEEAIKTLQAMLSTGTEDGQTHRYLYVNVIIDGKEQALLVKSIQRDSFGYDSISVWQEEA
jgi:hypothetical protein